MPRVFAESFDRGGFCGEEGKLCAGELESRGWSVIKLPRDSPFPSTFSAADLAVGSPAFMRRALSQLRVDPTPPPDYPPCLSAHLHRSVRTTTLADVRALFATSPSTRVFVKPARDAKAFNGELLSGAEEARMWVSMWMEAHGAAYPVHVSEPIDILVEHRAYVTRGVVVGIGHYGRSAPEGCPPLDLSVVHAAARTLYESVGRLEGCAMDWAVARRGDHGGEEFVTALVEVNDALFTGYYEGVSVTSFVDMLLARWDQVVRQARATVCVKE